jgi:hypothetical protein
MLLKVFLFTIIGYVSDHKYHLDKVYQSSKVVQEETKSLQEKSNSQKNLQLKKDMDTLLLYLQQEANKEASTTLLFLLDDCVFYLHGFQVCPQVDVMMNALIRSCMGTRLKKCFFQEINLQLLTHVIVHHDTNPKELDVLKKQVMKKCPFVHFISPKWLIDTLKCKQIQPEVLYPVEINNLTSTTTTRIQQQTASIPLSIPVQQSSFQLPVTFEEEPKETHKENENENGNGNGNRNRNEENPIFYQCHFLVVVVVCGSSQNKWLVQLQTNLNETHTNYQLITCTSLFQQDTAHIIQWSKLTHIVICHGVQFTKEQAKWLIEMKQNIFHLHGTKIKFVSDIWVASCFKANFMFSRSAHSLFPISIEEKEKEMDKKEQEKKNEPNCSMDFFGDDISNESQQQKEQKEQQKDKKEFVGGSIFPAQLPLVCFDKMVASISVYMGVERIVCHVVLEMVGAKVTNKLNKHRNTHLICYQPMGMKFQKAKEWRLEIRTFGWILQCIQHQKLLS